MECQLGQSGLGPAEVSWSWAPLPTGRSSTFCPQASGVSPEAAQRTPAREGDRRSKSLPATLRYTGKNSGGDLIFMGGEWVRGPAHTLHLSWGGQAG